MKKDTHLAEFLKNNSNLINVLKEGDLIEAELIEKTPRGVYFNLRSFSTGIVYGAELSNASHIVKGLNVGDKVSAKVVEVENEDGYVELSLASADKQRAWQEIKELQDRGEILTIKVTSANSGGLLAQVSKLEGFLPVSQLSPDHYPRVDDGDKSKILEELQKLVGQDLQVKILDINPRSHKLILSERETATANIKELLSKYKIGDVVDGIISGLADFGAFIRFTDNPDIEGLIHISELDYRIIDSPKEVVKVDDVVKAKIIEIKDGRVSLSLKALKADPWLGVGEKYKLGQDIEGVVAKFNPYGAVVNLEGGFQGLIHVSEFGGTEEMKKQIEQGKTYQFIIDAIKAEEKRIILKLKKAI